MNATRKQVTMLTFLFVASLSSFGCGHGVHNAWQVLPTGQELDICGDPHACTLQVYATQGWVSRGAGKVVVLKVLPHVPWQVRQDNRGHSASAWSQAQGAAAVFNAGFYDPNKQHVGWLKNAHVWQQPQRHPDWQGLLLSEPRDATATVATRIVDLQRDAEQDDVQQLNHHYAHVVQSMVLFDDTHGLRCRDSKAAASRTVVADDADGTLYVVVTQGAWRLARLADWLLAELPRVRQAINLDGGHEAQLAVQTEAGTLEFLGEHGSQTDLRLGRTRRLPFVWTLAPQQAQRVLPDADAP